MQNQILNEKEYHEALEKYGKGAFKAEMGAQAIRKLLREVDIEKLSEEIKKRNRNSNRAKKIKISKKIRHSRIIQTIRK